MAKSVLVCNSLARAEYVIYDITVQQKNYPVIDLSK